MNDPSASEGAKPPIERLAYKLAEAAAALGMSEISVRRLVARGELRPIRVLRHLIFPKAELIRFLEGR